jgi:hypothetical protein
MSRIYALNDPWQATFAGQTLQPSVRLKQTAVIADNEGERMSSDKTNSLPTALCTASAI